MGNYSYLAQQSEKHLETYNKNNLDFIELNSLPFCLICFPIEDQSSRQFQDFWNWFLNEHSAETYTPLNFEYLNHQIHIWIAAHQATETLFKTEKESYQTASVFDLLSNSLQQNILIALQDIQTALGQRNNTLLPLFRGNAQDLIEWLDDFKRAATANQYDNEYKFQIIGGYLQDSSAIWFLQETDAGAYQRIIKWAPTNAGEENTSFITWFETKFRTSILIFKWCLEKIVIEYAKVIRKLIKHVDSSRNWTEEQKIHSFTKELKTDLSYALWSLLALKNNLTIDMAIEFAQKIEDNQRMHLESMLPVFASASVMAPATFFAVQTQDPNEQLIDRLTANLAWLLESLAQAKEEENQG
ncbi:hypothetical protein G9A89_018125 [Geosiphon pyriformis]|nr:hypothetical protein G9A89_018125 [Geosiphon pyriformis]